MTDIIERFMVYMEVWIRVRKIMQIFMYADIRAAMN